MSSASVTARQRAEQWRLALVVPLQGPGAVFAPSCEAMGELAVSDLNADGGVLGREVQLEIVDGGADPRAVAEQVNKLITDGSIDAVSGWHISSVRNALAPVVSGRVPYVYPALYEGGETRRGIYCSGETPDAQIAPSLRWLRDNAGIRKWFVVGDDYVWPRASMKSVRRYIGELGLELAGERFVGLGRGDMRQVVAEAVRSRCDGVLMLLVGQDAVDFNRACADFAGDGAFVRFSPLMEESMLLASGAEATRGLFVASSFFSSMVSTASMDLLGRYGALHGPTPPPAGSVAESCYEGAQLLSHMCRRSDSLSEFDLSEPLRYESPRGVIEFQDSTTVQPVHLAIADGFDFDVLTTLPRSDEAG